MSNQISLWSCYFDVILHDNTSRINKYNYPLSLFILVDNNGKLQLGAQTFLNDETQESYEWGLQQMLDTTGSKPLLKQLICHYFSTHTNSRGGQKLLDTTMKQTIVFQGHNLRWKLPANTTRLCHCCGKLGCNPQSCPYVEIEDT
ncbi:unnamed protein product [Rhizophagus irregularis]|nr:unnamed protein product [Rhizophagus irregularis]